MTINLVNTTYTCTVSQHLTRFAHFQRILFPQLPCVFIVSWPRLPRSSRWIIPIPWVSASSWETACTACLTKVQTFKKGTAKQAKVQMFTSPAENWNDQNDSAFQGSKLCDTDMLTLSQETSWCTHLQLHSAKLLLSPSEKYKQPSFMSWGGSWLTDLPEANLFWSLRSFSL